MPVDTKVVSLIRTPRSDFDRRAIGVAGHLLMAGIWLERQFKNALPRKEES
jgi:hypothetical protein